MSENGGHLISVSEDGTIAVTNLNSREILKEINNFKPVSCNIGEKGLDKAEANRVNQFFELKEGKRESRRRNSIANDFSVNKYYNLVKVKSQKVFSYASFGRIDNITEVKNLNLI